MTETAILDSSAVLALLQKESGHDVVEAALLGGTCRISVVNYCEVLSKLEERGTTEADALDAIDKLPIEIAEFDRAAAVGAASLRSPTKGIGASLGDRACLSLATVMAHSGEKPAVYTAEKAWSRVKWPFKLVQIR